MSGWHSTMRRQNHAAKYALLAQATTLFFFAVNVDR
jgi:hypothetical protein